ncbi:metal dependent phosphohydrolase [Bacteriovorax stolpii]|nr:HD domain-containing protein [Bacteriovorax stolpii]TDP54356.1 metal dependent phosphohydrolase [Bacteriovorax stolpii]
MARIIINDPIHEVMDFGNDEKLKKVLKSAIDTNSFQRLRRISQLGLASFVFPGATHSRFSHSLGAAYLASLVLRKLSEQDHAIQKEIKNDFESVILSALLHDVGHGPFSHSFEHVLEGLAEDHKLKVIPMHEHWTAEIIKNKSSDIYAAIKKQKLDPMKIASPFIKKTKKKYYPSYLKQIVSSQIDVDRMDYLLRDSHFSGVSIGKFDLTYLINCLQVITHSKNDPKTLGLYYKGVKPYEAYLISRQLMNKSVYYHRKVKVAEYMAEAIFRYLIEREMKSKKSSPILPSYLKSISKILVKPDSFEMNEFLEKNVGDYIKLTEDDFWFNIKILAEENKNSQAHKFAQKLLKRDILPSYVINAGKDSICMEVLLANGFKEKIDYKILDLKTTIYKQSSDSDRVFVKDNSDNINEISSFSMLISSLGNKPDSEKILVVLGDDEKSNKKLANVLRTNGICTY